MSNRIVKGLTLLSMIACFQACSVAPPPTQASAPSSSMLRLPQFGPVPPLPAPHCGPITTAQIELGRTLFFDSRLSGSGHTSCNSCHVRNIAFQDNLNLSSPDRSFPNDSPTVQRNTPSLLNIIYAPRLRWDGSQADLGYAMVYPLAEANMNLAQLPSGDRDVDVPAAQAALYHTLTVTIPGYVALYQAAFGTDLRNASPEHAWDLTGNALAAFASQMVSRDAPFDRWNAGDDSAIDASAVRGAQLFVDKGCAGCHTGPLFTDFAFHNLSTSPPGPDGRRADEGRYAVTGNEADRGAFLTPTLRQAYDTSPYFHDGSQPALRDLLAFMASPKVTADPNRDPAFAKPLDLDDSQIDDLVAFLKSLRGQPLVGLTPPSAFPE